MTKYAGAMAVVFTLGLATISQAAAMHYRGHPSFVYARDFNYSISPRGIVEGRFSTSVDRACKVADKNKKFPAPRVQLVSRFRCKSGDGVNQFQVLR
jgi:hypothetical protein